MKIHYFTPWVLQTLVWVPTRLVFILFTKLKIRGKENLKYIKKSGVIFASNHASEMDPIMTPVTLTPFSSFFPMFYVSRGKDFYTTSGWRQKIYGGLFFALWGAYPAYSGKKDYSKSLKYHIELLSNGKSLHIFPEGRKTKDGGIRDKIHGGAAYLSWRTNTPIVPVAIKGTFKTTAFDFFSGKKKYSIYYGAPVYPSELFIDTSKEPTPEECKNASIEIMKKVRELTK
jgi:1-acyl-sn-glycerol-3-phosphate acyltransferase